MKREIKFRVFDNVDHMAIFTLEDLMTNKIAFTSDSPVMQFTGLPDKNGKEIYEGDIILVNGLNGFIKYLGCSFMIEWIGTDVYSDLLGWDNYKTGKISEGTDYEIIGNVFENPELLNQTV